VENFLKKLLKKAKGITDNSKEVGEGYIFFAIRGTKYDGHRFLEEVLKKKPFAVVVEKGRKPQGVDIPVIEVGNTRKAFALACRTFYGEPDKKLKVFGITGTNGKTSTTYILSQILNYLGESCGIVGTVEYRFADKVYGKGQTTPHPKVWFKTLKRMLLDGAKAVACEVSSHALDQYRIYGTEFEGVIFTNLSQDHLDYHRTIEDYFNAKRRLFTEYKYKVGIVNGDDIYGRKLLEAFPHLVSFGFGEYNKYRILEGKSTFEGTYIKLETPKGILKLETPLLGDFQIYNITGAVALLSELGYDLPKITEAVSELKPIPGRFEVVVNEPFKVVIDYAHTPDALEKLLISVRKLKPKRVITVFGAGGNRDRAKRPLMGEVVSKYSDVVIITSDNPRWEEPLEIIKHILEGVDKTKTVYVEEERKKAIELALNIARRGDIVVIAGKGHEDYQEIKGVRYPFNDREVVVSLIGKMRD
jgi:UDP-N-acetylmuramoyl-L-alanyl-D-glutamate--2,6-diaminopimelate ligase